MQILKKSTKLKKYAVKNSCGVHISFLTDGKITRIFNGVYTFTKEVYKMDDKINILLYSYFYCIINTTKNKIFNRTDIL